MPSSAAEIFRSLDRELWIVTAAHGARRSGLIVAGVSSASIVAELPRVLVSMGNPHWTTELVRASGSFALHLISAAQSERVVRFGLQSGRDADKFAGLEVTTNVTGAPVLADAPAWLDCRVESEFSAGDRTVILGEVVAADRTSGDAPLTLHQWIRMAPPAYVQALRDQMERDAAADAVAIQQWRGKRSSCVSS